MAKITQERKREPLALGQISWSWGNSGLEDGEQFNARMSGESSAGVPRSITLRMNRKEAKYAIIALAGYLAGHGGSPADDGHFLHEICEAMQKARERQTRGY